MNDNHALPDLVQPVSGMVLPDQLAQQAADAVRELLVEAAAENTTRSYATALRYWAGWHTARYGVELVLPVSEAVVLQFVVDHVQRRSADGGLAWELPPAVDQALVAAGLKAKPGPWTLATVRHRVAVLSTAHRLKQVPNPCEQPAVRTVLGRAARAAVKRDVRPRKKTAIPLSELEAMLATCDDSLVVLRDRAALALEDWLDASGITEGTIFRRLWKDRVGPALSGAAVAEIVQRRARIAGLEGDVGGHSLRSGFVTEASRQGVSLPAIMQLTEHRAVSSVIGYFQTGGATTNPAARLLED